MSVFIDESAQSWEILLGKFFLLLSLWLFNSLLSFGAFFIFSFFVIPALLMFSGLVSLVKFNDSFFPEGLALLFSRIIIECLFLLDELNGRINLVDIIWRQEF
jgi:hypothetical protein